MFGVDKHKELDTQEKFNAYYKAFKYEFGVGIRTGVILGQAGEFSFVILALANEQNLIGGETLQIVLSVCLLSMITASFLIPYNGKIARSMKLATT